MALSIQISFNTTDAFLGCAAIQVFLKLIDDGEEVFERTLCILRAVSIRDEISMPILHI